MEYMAGRYSHAIYSKDGGWPPVLEKYFQAQNNETNFWQRKLPPFTLDEIELIKGSFDFYAMNHYSSRVIIPAAPGEVLEPWPLGDIPDLHAKLEKHPGLQESHSTVLNTYPEAFRKSLAWVKKQYGDIPILITENGYSTTGGLEDGDRIKYFMDYMKQMLVSIKEDGVHVTGYTAWSLMDVFEWVNGYTAKLGLYQVDFSSPRRTRRPRASARFYSDVIRKHSLNITVNV